MRVWVWVCVSVCACGRVYMCASAHMRKRHGHCLTRRNSTCTHTHCAAAGSIARVPARAALTFAAALAGAQACLRQQGPSQIPLPVACRAAVFKSHLLELACRGEINGWRQGEREGRQVKGERRKAVGRGTPQKLRHAAHYTPSVHCLGSPVVAVYTPRVAHSWLCCLRCASMLPASIQPDSASTLGSLTILALKDDADAAAHAGPACPACTLAGWRLKIHCGPTPSPP